MLCLGLSLVFMREYGVVRRTAGWAAPALASPCDSLASLALKGATITKAELVAGGTFSSYKNLPEFCRVAATLTPTSDSDIKVEIWLPANGWNGKLQAVGNGGWAGTISYSAMAELTGLSKRTCQNAVARLQRRGLVQISRKGATDAAEYRPLRPWDRASV